MNQRIGPTARDEIRTAMKGLAGADASLMARQLAEAYDLTPGYVYTLTADVRERTRKRRSDCGKRKFDIVEGTDTFEAASLVLGAKLDPDQAILTARANGAEQLPTIATLQRLLRDKGLDRKNRRYPRRNHRRFEAAAPLDLIQIDSTALKIRWADVKTRRILRIEGVDKNHPQMDAGKIRVWQVMGVDDNTRRRFLRYVVTSHITSKDMVRFLCDLAAEWGIPKQIYTDNGPEFKGFFKKAITILSSIPTVKTTGGIEHFTHMPNNPQASGKVENAHQWAEKMDRYIGLAEQRGLAVTADKLDGFADAICRNYNEQHVHRTTGQTPVARWHGTSIVQRMLPKTVVQSALLFDEAERKIAADMTIRVGNLDYRLPARDASGHASPFRTGMRVRVVVPHELDLIFVTLENGDEYEINKVIATADTAGEYKTAAPSEAEQLAKALQAHHKERNREAKARKATTGETYQVPHFNHEVAAQATNVAHFPHPVTEVPHDELAAATPVPLPVGPQAASLLSDVAGTATSDERQAVGTRAPLPARDASTYTGRSMTYWQAVDEFKDRFSDLNAAKTFLLTLYPDRQGTVPAVDIEQAMTGPQAASLPNTGGLRLAS